MLRRRTAFRLLAVAISLVLTLGVLEIGLRVVARSDADGNLFVGRRRLRPFVLPVQEVRAEVEAYNARGDRTYFRYDPDLGWTVRPGGHSDDGLYFANAMGVRSSEARRSVALAPAPGTLRIALFGDSFTHCNDVPYEQSWGAILERELTSGGLPAEVLNLGGSGYGLDQALLRWRKEGRRLSPDLVVLGFQATNVRRDLNLIRKLYNPDTGLIFSKPRFVLEGERLRLVNVPAVPPERLVETLEHFDRWELRPYEFFYREENYRDSPLYASRALAFLSSAIGTRFSNKRKDYDFYDEGSEARELAFRIVQAFASEVEAAGARFLIVHVPTSKPLAALREGSDLEYEGLLDDLRARFEVVDPAAALLSASETSSPEALFQEVGGHYSVIANTAIATTLARHLEAEGG